MKRFKHKLLRIFKRKVNLAKDERYVESIVTKYLEDDAVRRLMSPQEEYLIIDDKNQIYISIYLDTITISNHDFLYRKNFSGVFCRRLEGKIREIIKKDRERLKNELFKNELDLLEKIKNRI